jgi:UDP-N-acetyl-D-galactosamine dehydrogenase
MARGSIVVYESTVYPGLTEDVCRKVLEQASGMKYQEDFFLGYSPERINPGDKVHSLENVVKIVSASTAEALDVVDSVYRSVIKAGTHRAPSIATAEAAKIIENVQRDINIALVNELALIFERIGLDTLDVLEAAKTKWNFMPFHPGLVGGHCIGVDPYYLTYLAESLNVNPQVIASGRKINDRMGRFVGEKMIRMIFNGPTPGGAAQVAVCGMTFKENVPDLRNTKVHDLVACLEDFGVRVYCLDPLCDPDEFKEEFGRKLDHWDELPQLDGLIMAVPHETYRRDMSLAKIASRLKGARAFLDLKGIYDPREAKALGLNFWRL